MFPEAARVRSHRSDRPRDGKKKPHGPARTRLSRIISEEMIGSSPYMSKPTTLVHRHKLPATSSASRRLARRLAQRSLVRDDLRNLHEVVTGLNQPDRFRTDIRWAWLQAREVLTGAMIGKA